jgi:hypothetical protein
MTEKEAKELLFFIMDNYSMLGVEIGTHTYSSKDFVNDIRGKMKEVFILPELKKAVDSNPLNDFTLELLEKNNVMKYLNKYKK